ncbi:hypothetical protein [Acinetobacter sp. WCHAc010052]|uniref:hypothetical protein n=1 Tax=Acinetobacter sp. WCHAc010052 TaxID=2004647 RepID=UPI000B3D0B9E|nr:hypothetical protein [Acinetobacter sp. WCHAc010052]AXY60601.1 hypothetical protein CDG61_11535 [Acinetobacter sp. WCHAc010052]
MNIKFLGVTVFSAFVLAACGGGDSSDSGNASAENIPNDALGESVVNNPEWASYELGYAPPSSDYPNLLTKELLTIQNGNIYNNLVYTNSGIFPTDDYDLYTDSLTADGLYQTPKTKTQWGYHIGVDLNFKKNGSQWTFTPNSIKKLKGLQFTIDYEVIDLSGKPLSYYIDTYTHLSESDLQSTNTPTTSNYLKKLQGLNFPKGSVCLREKTSSSNQPVMDIYYYNPLDSDWLQDLNRYFPDGYKTQKIAGYSVHISNEIYDYSRDALLNTGTEYAQGDYYEKAGIMYNIQDEIAELEELIKDRPANKNHKWELEAAKNQCTLFNKTASTYIDSAQKLK